MTWWASIEGRATMNRALRFMRFMNTKKRLHVILGEPSEPLVDISQAEVKGEEELGDILVPTDFQHIPEYSKAAFPLL